MSTQTHPAQAPAPSAPATAGRARAGGFPAPRPGSLWRGRVVLIIGIVLLGITLRHAVTGLSPLLPLLRQEMGLDLAAASFLGMLPTLSFGVAGFLAPVLIRRSGPELTAALAMVLAAAGTFGRALTDSIPLFFVLSVVALFGMGIGNVVGAPLVKKYFPDRQAAMLTVFALLMQAGATLPAMTAVPLNNAAGWRASIATWSILSLAAALPWIIQLVRLRRNRTAATAGTPTPATASGPKLGLTRLVTSPIAVGTALFYAMASLNTYGMLAWLPTILKDSGMDLGAAAGAFSAFTFMTLPMAFIVPILASKLKNVFPLAAALSLVAPIGYIGLVLAPGTQVLWVFIMGIGGGAFPLAITMFNKRTRTAAGSAALAGFAMGVGYLFGTLGPLLGGTIFSLTGGWTTALLVFAGTGAVMVTGAWMMTPRNRYLEDKFTPATPANQP
ncbi:MFS transporter [Arthrobacter sp. PAMC25564]|uniref:MFS transporter n=1 Tax=Arthrobacter sp. PAMC25564 TaxID=2565366 RepID=UPI0010A29573|nr:MFS transporter [Arthrobacter sp. PAMC25564]QCB97597.1 MFS transporter [Arthrobacter sp. PAMC25564]